MQPGWDFTQTATCRSFLLARTGWFSMLLHLGSNYCHWVAIRFIGLDARTKSDIQASNKIQSGTRNTREGAEGFTRVHSSGILQFNFKQKQHVCFLYWHNRLSFLGFPSCMWLQTFLPSCPMVLSVSLCHKHVILYSVSLSFSPQGISSFFRWSCKNSAPAPPLPAH